MTNRPSSDELPSTAAARMLEATLAGLYDTWAGKLLLYGRALGLSSAEAEDVLHDVFAAVLKLTHIPDEPERYLVRAFRNRSINHHRSWWRRVARELESHHWFDPAEPISPEESAAVECMNHLPVEQRETIVLKLWHQYTFEEIAVLQNVSANTAAGRYRYALQKLRSCLLKPSDRNEIDDEIFPRSRIGPDAIEFAGLSSACRGNS